MGHQVNELPGPYAVVSRRIRLGALRVMVLLTPLVGPSTNQFIELRPSRPIDCFVAESLIRMALDPDFIPRFLSVWSNSIPPRGPATYTPLPSSICPGTDSRPGDEFWLFTPDQEPFSQAFDQELSRLGLYALSCPPELPPQLQAIRISSPVKLPRVIVINQFAQLLDACSLPAVVTALADSTYRCLSATNCATSLTPCFIVCLNIPAEQLETVKNCFRQCGSSYNLTSSAGGAAVTSNLCEQVCVINFQMTNGLNLTDIQLNYTAYATSHASAADTSGSNESADALASQGSSNGLALGLSVGLMALVQWQLL
ncbi:hypothetical protein H4R33_002488 [Dimargaris cristalligena]|nr:hypothetical protein H4R33_002488 [Dimargaris cristalligena]